MESPSNRLLTIPNVISFVRLLCIPYFVYLVFGQEREAAAAVVLAILGATDWIDGFIARRYNQVSSIGKFVDPAADRLLLVVAAVSIIIVEAMPLWFGIIAGFREALVIFGGVVLATKGIKGLDVEYIGKAGALALMVSLPLFLVAHSGVSWNTEALIAAWIFGVPGIVLNYVSAYHYYKRGRAMLAAKSSPSSSETVAS